MAEPRRLDRLTAQDLMMLWPDELGWSQDIAALAILDGTRLLDRDGRVRIQAIRRQLEPRLHLVPRFRQLLYRPRQGLGWPLWEAWLLPGLPAQQVGLLLRAHHTLVDGVAGVAAFGALLDPPADAPTPVAPPWTPAPLPTAGELLRDNLRRRLLGLGRGLSGLAHPSRTLRGARRAWSAWREAFAERAPAPASTVRSVPTAGWRSSAAAWRLPSGSPTHTTPRSTTWSWPPSPAACAGCWQAVARTSRSWCCARWCPSRSIASSLGRHAATRTP